MLGHRDLVAVIGWGVAGQFGQAGLLPANPMTRDGTSLRALPPLPRLPPPLPPVFLLRGLHGHRFHHAFPYLCLLEQKTGKYD